MQVLVLSDSFQPLYTCGVERAITLLYLGKAVSVKDSDALIHSPSVIMRIPKAIRLLVRAVLRRYSESKKPSRQGIFRRDRNTCQYCGKKGQVTVDHVFPRSRGGADTWENLVTACFSCNNRKGNHSPEEAGMPLLRAPRPPRHLEFSFDLWDQLLGF
ncbi:MAG TPA: HNH endonuclease [Chroococcales cyanobacterium]|jgi:5-methylcytosine-specific restriction endonuclease McrA